MQESEYTAKFCAWSKSVLSCLHPLIMRQSLHFPRLCVIHPQSSPHASSLQLGFKVTAGVWECFIWLQIVAQINSETSSADGDNKGDM